MEIKPLTLGDQELEQVGEYSLAEILEGLQRLPISVWRYNEEEGEPLHLGPMAQDFQKVFGLGASDREIAAVDALGVALASIKALLKRVEALEHEVEILKKS